MSDVKQSVLDAVVAKLDEVDQRRDEDWVLLGEKLRDAILDKDEVRAVFTEEQKAALVAVCRETYYAASVVARAYALQAIEVYDRKVPR